MKPESAIAWAIHTLQGFYSRMDHPTRMQLDEKLTELHRLDREHISNSSLACHTPGCNYVCPAPDGMEANETVVCPEHGSVLSLLSWKQFGVKAADAMHHMENIILYQQKMVDRLSSQTMRAAQSMKGAQDELKDLEYKLDEHKFLTANEREELEQWREWEHNPFDDFAKRVARSVDDNAHRRDWYEWQPTVDEIYTELDAIGTKLFIALDKRNRFAVDANVAEIGSVLIKTIQLYGNPTA